MSLFDDPPTRNRTYIDLMILEPGDLNDLQDAAIGRHSQRRLAYGPGDFRVESGTVSSHTARSLVFPTLTELRRFSVDLRLPVGTRILAAVPHASAMTGGSWQGGIERVPKAAPGSPVAILTIGSGAAFDSASFPVASGGHVVLADSTYSFFATHPSGTNNALTWTYLEIVYDHP